MGDVGSAFLGYTLAVLPLMFARSAVGIGPTAALIWAILLLWPFLFDTSYTLVRRLFRGENIVTAHRSHLYQRLTAAGHTHLFVTILYVFLAVAGALVAQIWSPVAVVEEHGRCGRPSVLGNHSAGCGLGVRTETSGTARGNTRSLSFDIEGQ